MSYLEELLPEFRNGAKIRKESWSNGEYINADENIGFYDEKGNSYFFSFDDFKSDSWELYQGPKPDWEYIIKNKCLCWFRDDFTKQDIAAKLTGYIEGASHPFEIELDNGGYLSFKNCRPVRKDEVIFYEDGKQ